jgi:protoporphyrin/coproporphyrin ferrochelatase
MGGRIAKARQGAGRCDAVASWCNHRQVPRLDPYDAVLLLSFGGPEGPDDVLPFLENVTRGRGIPRERLVDVASHYDAVGGRSPINEQNRALLQALRAELTDRGVDLPVAWGNRNWAPYVVDALRELHEGGARRVCVVTTSAYSSYSGCRQYREDLGGALLALAAEGRQLAVDRIRAYYDHPGFVAPMTAAVRAALEELPEALREPARLVFVTHSIPTAMDDGSGPHGHAYAAQHRELAAEIAGRLATGTGISRPWDLVFCSRSGSPAQPWLEPDVNDHLEDLHQAGTPAVVLAPIGFVSDHMEVVHDLDTEAAGTAAGLGLPMVRASTVGTSADFVRGLVDLVVERAAEARGDHPERAVVGHLGPWPSTCVVGCCPNSRSQLPAAAGRDWVSPSAAEPAR